MYYIPYIFNHCSEFEMLTINAQIYKELKKLNLLGKGKNFDKFKREKISNNFTVMVISLICNVSN